MISVRSLLALACVSLMLMCCNRANVHQDFACLGTHKTFTLCLTLLHPCARQAWILCIIWPVNQRRRWKGREAGFKMFITQQQGND